MSKEEIIEYVKKHKSLNGIEKELEKFSEEDLSEIYDKAINVNCRIVKNIPKTILIKNASLMIKAVKQNLYLLKYIPKEALEKHPSICLKAVARYPFLLDSVPDNIKIEKPEICIDAVREMPYLMKYVPDIVKIKHPKFCFEILEKQNSEIENIPVEVLKRDADFVYNLLRKNNKIHYDKIPQELNEQFQDKCVEFAYENIEGFNMLTNETKKANIELCILAAKSGKFTLENFPEEILKENPQIYGGLAETGRFWPKDFPEEVLKDNPDIWVKFARTGRLEPEKFPEEILKDNPHIYIDCAKGNIDFFRNIPKEVMYANEEEIIEMVKSDVKKPSYCNYCLYKEVPKEILLSHPEIYEKILKNLSIGQVVSLFYIPIEIQEKYPEDCIRILKESLISDQEAGVANVLSISKKILGNNPDLCLEIIEDWDYALDVYSSGVKEFKDELNIYDILPKELLEDINFVKRILEIDERVFFNCSSEIKNQLLNKEETPIGIEWQNECLEEIQNQSNVILSAPTGSGKTKVFLQWALQKKEKPIYITAPIKALSNQRYRELKEQGYTVGLETGDIKNVPVNCDFICCTQEIYTNKYVEQKDATLIMDEFHYIFENPDRARTYIDALHNSKAKNILLCSATMGNIEKLAEYVENVSKRDFDTYEGKSRLTELEYKGKIASNDIKNALVVAFSQRNIKMILLELIGQRGCVDELKDKEIEQIFEKYKVENNELKEYLHYGVAGYYGRLLPKEKLLIEECFEKGLIDTVVGTDALAMGVNFPVENVVFAQLAKFYDGPISKNLFEQIAGRAGRKGFFEKGNVYYCDDFTNLRGRSLEAKGYDTGELFAHCMLEQNEDVSIELFPHIKNILKGSSTIEEEAEFISRYSFPQKDLDETIYDVNYEMKEIVGKNAFENIVEEMLDEEFGYDEEEYDDYYEREKTYHVFNKDDEEVCERREELLSLKEKFYKELPNIYFEEYSPKKNCKLFLEILSGVEPDTIIDTDIDPEEDFYDLLQFRKYVKSLPKKYRKGLTKINDMIDDIDETAMGGFGEKLDINEVIETLEMEGKLSGVNVMRVLKEQELEQKMAERADIIDEQMKIAEQYGLEDY